MSAVIPPLATRSELYAAFVTQRSAPFLWLYESHYGAVAVRRITADNAARVDRGVIMRLTRRELLARAAMSIWDAEIAEAPGALLTIAYAATFACYEALRDSA